jgi:hypothetical protein
MDPLIADPWPAAIAVQVLRRPDRRRQFRRARHRRLRAAGQTAEGGAHRVHGRGQDVLRMDDKLDADPFQLRVARHVVPAGQRGHGERRLAVARRHRFAHLRFGLWRVEEQDIGAFGLERF